MTDVLIVDSKPRSAGRLMIMWLPRILVLVPRTFRIGIGILACTMRGACIAWLTVLHGPQNIVIPGTLLVMLMAVGIFSR